ncbi:MAG: hypothetical protein ACOVO3_03605 [Fluviicola sp.]
MTTIKNSLRTFFRTCGTELSIVLIFLFVLNNFLDKAPTTINADGIGYYDFLPSAFIRSDLNRNDFSFKSKPEAYQKLPENIGYVEIDDRLVNKYPIGTAVLESPFFLVTHFTQKLQDIPHNGYEPSFQKTVQFAAIFYLFLGLIFFKLLLQRYAINYWKITLAQLLLVLATPIVHYASADAGFSHVYSFFAIAAFAYFAKCYFEKQDFRSFVWTCIFLGLILLIRQINVLVIFALPFLAGSWSVFLSGMRTIVGSWKRILIGTAIAGIMLSPQLIAWYLQTGHWVVYSYQGETFDFTQPHFLDILFSYKKGLFIYTPLFFISFCTSIIWLFKRNWFTFLSFNTFFALVTYVLSSWWSWYYGCSFGMRAFIDFFPILILPLLLTSAKWRVAPSLILSATLLTFIPLNLIQALQYKRYILHWIDMDETKYWQVFLKTDPKYQGLIWKPTIDFGIYRELESFGIKNLQINTNGEQLLADIRIDTLRELDQLALVSWDFDHQFPENSEIRLRLTIADSAFNTIYFSHEVPLIHFQNTGFNKVQRGSYNYTFPTLTPGATIIRLTAISNEKTVLKNGRIRLFGPAN